MGRINLKDLDAVQLGELLAGMGQPAYRAKQLEQWLYVRDVRSLGEITVFSKDLRASLHRVAYVGGLVESVRQVSADGTEKFAFELDDGLVVESVLIPGPERLTLCISSQVGCAMGCRFCLTGSDGLKRNLRAWEIAEQLVAARRAAAPRKITNVVLMGMGEPLHNIGEVCEALRRITGPIGFSGRRVTVSTCGLAERLPTLARCAPGVNLAVSLNATTDEVRDEIMPVNRRYPLAVLMEACRRYPLKKRRRITFEYVLMAGVNDTPGDARRLVRLLHGIPSKVNLIPYNGFEGGGFSRPADAGVVEFQEALCASGLTVMVRSSMGADILAACGQLSAAVKPHFS